MLLWAMPVPIVMADEERIDASDPTKIYTFMGGGFKYNDYSNGEYMWEARAIGNVGLKGTDGQNQILFGAMPVFSLVGNPVRSWKTTGIFSSTSLHIFEKQPSSSDGFMCVLS